MIMVAFVHSYTSSRLFPSCCFLRSYHYYYYGSHVSHLRTRSAPILSLSISSDTFQHLRFSAAFTFFQSGIMKTGCTLLSRWSFVDEEPGFLSKRLCNTHTSSVICSTHIHANENYDYTFPFLLQ